MLKFEKWPKPFLGWAIFGYRGHGKAVSSVKPKISGSSVSEICYGGAALKGPWEAVRQRTESVRVHLWACV